MARYEVNMPEVWYQTYTIEADSPEQALDDVRFGNGDPIDDSLEYSHSLPEGLDISQVREVK